MKNKSLAYPIIFMTLLTVITVFILAFLNQTTLAKVEENQNLELRRKILYVFDMYEEGKTSDDEVNKLFEDHVVESDWNYAKLFTLMDGSSEKAYAVPFSGPGLWGSITGYIGVDANMNEVTGVEFISQNETPGLGGRISEAPYKEQYRNVDISNATDKYIINRPAPGGNIDAIAGATQTSTFVQNMINEDLKAFDQGGNK
ncbi:FMN-binding protein [Neofamilia massiliensis]|uniref:FMN-binding protein n=1 Tax=Neofamilia massiliensis TaxID=1673724 RepID=UPI0006BB8C54|nr:FMN-binding protein [Neofamilia massiliensis]